MRSILFLAAASFALAIALAAPAPGQESVSTGRPVLLSADQVSYDEELGIVIATGNVEIAQDVRVLMADTVTYNERTNQVVATGNVSLLEPDGNVVFAEYVELTDDMKNGVVRDLAVLMTDNSRFAAAGGRLEGGVRTQLRKAVYSPCELCEDDPERAPLWQLKAEKVVHDKRTHDIEYTDVWLEMAGIPVLYSPYLSHPDPTVKRRTGFLAPTMGSDSQLGFVVRTPYYFTIGPDKDATLEPIFTSKERVALAGEYRQRFSDGEIEASGSITRVRRRGSDGEQLDEDKTRGTSSAADDSTSTKPGAGASTGPMPRTTPIYAGTNSAPRTHSPRARSRKGSGAATTCPRGATISRACGRTTTPATRRSSCRLWTMRISASPIVTAAGGRSTRTS